MNNIPSLPSRPARSQSDTTTTAAGHEWNNGISRRSFLKRTGGATLGTMVAWHLSTSKSNAEENVQTGESAEKWGMTCKAPSFENSSVDWISIPGISVAQRDVPENTAGETAFFFIQVEINSNKIEDPPSTRPYNECNVNYTAKIKALVDVSQSVEFFGDYLVSCNEDSGAINWNMSYCNWDSDERNIELSGIGGFDIAKVNINIRRNNGIPLGFFIRVTYLYPMTGPFYNDISIPVELYNTFISSPTIFSPKVK